MSKILKYIRLVTVAAMLGTLCGVANAAKPIKVLDRSASKAPVWLDGTQEEYVITSAIADDMDAARNQCLDNVKTKIIESVAQNVQFGSESRIAQSTGNSGITDFTDQFTSVLKTQSANIPFIRGISVSKIADSYWEKRMDKATKKVTYLYAIKYPFPRIELKKMTREFEKRDHEMVTRYNALDRGLDSVASLEQIDRAIEELNPLITYFFDDVRKQAAISLQSNYRKLYDQIVIETAHEKSEEAFLVFRLNGRPIAVSQKPKVKSECATRIVCHMEDSGCRVTYSTEFCEENVPGEIRLTFRFGSRPVQHLIYFTKQDLTVQIRPVGTAYLTAQKGAADTLQAIHIRLEIENKNCDRFCVTGVALNVPGIVGAVVIDGLEIPFTGEAKHLLQLDYTVPITYTAGHDNKLQLMRGTIRGTYGEESTSFSTPFSLMFKSNW